MCTWYHTVWANAWSFDPTIHFKLNQTLRSLVTYRGRQKELCVPRVQRKFVFMFLVLCAQNIFPNSSYGSDFKTRLLTNSNFHFIPFLSDVLITWSSFIATSVDFSDMALEKTFLQIAGNFFRLLISCLNPSMNFIYRLVTPPSCILISTSATVC